MYNKAKFASDDIICNNTNLVEFTAQYNAQETFEYLNKRAMRKYRLNTDEVKIIDLTGLNNIKETPQVIVITSR